MIKSKELLNILLISSFLLIFSHPAHAYIDPNTSSTLLQILTPIIGIVIFTWKFITYYVKKIFLNIIKSNNRKNKQ